MQSILYQSTIENIEMHFSLGGSSHSSSNTINRNQIFNFKANQHNIIYSKEVDAFYTYQGPDFGFFEIKIKPCVFLNYIYGDTRLLNIFQEVILAGKFKLIQNENRTISISMLDIISEIMNCSYTGIFKKMFIEAKVIELLVLQLEQFVETKTKNISRQKLEQVHEIRNFIASNLSSSYSLIDLAHMVGTNEFALKKSLKKCLVQQYLDIGMTYE